MKVNLLAPAKINLGLEIIGKRNDGYHEVDMVMQAINLFDEVCIEDSSELYIKVNINKDIGCNQRENIAYKATKKFFEYVGIKNKGVNISIKKNIPICAGLAGGSSDGAAVIVGLNEIFNTHLTQQEMMKIGEKIGADVPFCILGGIARASGIGTTLIPLIPLSKFYIILVKPNLYISTKDAYSMIDNSKLALEKRTQKLVEAIQSKDIFEVCDKIFNHFEEVHNICEVSYIKKALLENGAKVACMSGSGPSVFGIYLDKNTALSSFEWFVKNNMEVFLCEPISYGVKKSKNPI